MDMSRERWSAVVSPEEENEVRFGVEKELHITQVSLSNAKITGAMENVCVKAIFRGNDYTIANLSSKFTPQATFDLVYQHNLQLHHDRKDGDVHFLGYITDKFAEDSDDGIAKVLVLKRVEDLPRSYLQTRNQEMQLMRKKSKGYGEGNSKGHGGLLASRHRISQASSGADGTLAGTIGSRAVVTSLRHTRNNFARSGKAERRRRNRKLKSEERKKKACP